MKCKTGMVQFNPNNLRSENDPKNDTIHFKKQIITQITKGHT